MLNPRIDQLTDYPFDRLRGLLSDMDAPADPIVLSIGEPQGAPPPWLAETIAAKAHLWGKYPPGPGTPELRAACAGWLTRRFDLPATLLDPDAHVLPVAGTREALYLIGQVAVPETRNGRRPVVLIPNPFYQVYLGAAVMAGAEPVLYQDLAEVDAETWARAALCFLCSPSNPTGAVADAESLRAAIALAREHDVLLCADECYSELWTGQPPPGALAQAGGRLDNLLVFHSLSKRSAAAGLRSGFVAGDPRVIKAFTRLRSYGGATLPLPVQAASAALWADESHVEANLLKHQHRMALAREVLGVTPPAGGFFLWLDVGDGERVARDLWARGLRVLPGAYLAREDATGANPGRPFIRVALVHDAETVARALDILNTVLESRG